MATRSTDAVRTGQDWTEPGLLTSVLNDRHVPGTGSSRWRYFFSGVWLAGNPLPCPPCLRDGNDCIEKIALSRQAADIAMDLTGGLPYQPWAAALQKGLAAAYENPTRPEHENASDLVDPNRKVIDKRGCRTGNPSAALRSAAPGYHYTRDHLLSF